MIIAIDPGLNVGLAFRFDNTAWGTLTMPPRKDWDANFQDLIHELRKRAASLSCVVIESFVGRQQMLSKYGIETIELVGAVRGACLVFNIELIKQTPGERFSMVAEATSLLAARRKELKISYTDHEISALSHLLVYERRARTGAANAASGLPSARLRRTRTRTSTNN